MLTNCTVGDHAKINSSQCEDSSIASRCEVGPFAHLRPHSVLEEGSKIGAFVQLKNCNLGQGTKMATSPMWATATWGPGCNFGCGTVTCNYDGKVKSRTTIGANVFIGCQTKFIPPVSVGDGAYIAAGTTITDDVPEHSFVIGRSPAGGQAGLERQAEMSLFLLRQEEIGSTQHSLTERGSNIMISHGKDLKIFSGSSNKALAEAICNDISIPLGNAEVGAFSDGENFVSIYETVRGSDVFVVQSTCSPVNDNLMEMLIMIDALKRASAGRITAVIPYFGYARQDRKTKPRDPISAKLVANLITRAGADRSSPWTSTPTRSRASSTSRGQSPWLPRLCGAFPAPVRRLP